MRNVQRPGAATSAVITLLASPARRVRIDYAPTGFPQPQYPNFAAADTLPTTHNAICRALYECGGWARLYNRRAATPLPYAARTSLFSNLRALGIVLQWRLAFTLAGDRVRTSSMFNSLASSERAHVWYYVGMAMPHLLLQARGAIRWTMHYEWYRLALGLPPMSGPRPDLIARLRVPPAPRTGRARWAVIEAKGSGRPKTNAAARAKAQAQAVRFGQPTRSAALEVGSSTHIRGGLLCMDLVDPEPTRDIVFPDVADDMIRGFYAPIVRLIGDDVPLVRAEVGGRKVRLGYIGSLDIWLGVDEEVAEIATGNEKGIEESLSPVLDLIDQAHAVRVEEALIQESVAMGPDGLVTLLGPSWT